MKKVLFGAIALFAMCIGLVACGNVGAATLPNEFATTQPNLGLINVSSMRSFDASITGYVNIYYADGSEDTIADPQGKIYAALKTFPGVVSVPGSTAYINVNATKHIVCAGGSTTLGWSQGQSTVLADPGCAFYNAVKALAN